MTTLTFGSERNESATMPMKINAPASRAPLPVAGVDQVAVADTELMPARPMAHFEDAQQSVPPPIMKRPLPAFPVLTAGLLSTAAVWLGLAMFVAAVAYPMADIARAALSLMGTSLIAAVIALAATTRPETA